MDAETKQAAAIRDAIATILERRAEYFERTKGRYSREDAARSYRATAAEIRKLPLPQEPTHDR